jgi:hypothetical protein
MWGTASQDPGVKALNRGRIAVITSLSCSTGGCAAGGFTTGIGNGASTGKDTVPVQAFLVDETGGSWNQAVRVPGLAGVSSPRSEIDLITCGPAGADASSCAAIGDYQIQRGSPRAQMFITVHADSPRSVSQLFEFEHTPTIETLSRLADVLELDFSVDVKPGMLRLRRPWQVNRAQANVSSANDWLNRPHRACGS